MELSPRVFDPSAEILDVASADETTNLKLKHFSVPTPNTTLPVLYHYFFDIPKQLLEFAKADMNAPFVAKFWRNEDLLPAPYEKVNTPDTDVDDDNIIIMPNLGEVELDGDLFIRFSCPPFRFSDIREFWFVTGPDREQLSASRAWFRWHTITDGPNGTKTVLQAKNLKKPTGPWNFDMSAWRTLYKFTGGETEYTLADDVWPDAAVASNYTGSRDLKGDGLHIEIKEGSNSGYHQLYESNNALFIYVGDAQDPESGHFAFAAWPVIEHP